MPSTGLRHASRLAQARARDGGARAAGPWLVAAIVRPFRHRHRDAPIRSKGGFLRFRKTALEGHGIAPHRIRIAELALYAHAEQRLRGVCFATSGDARIAVGLAILALAMTHPPISRSASGTFGLRSSAARSFFRTAGIALTAAQPPLIRERDLRVGVEGVHEGLLEHLVGLLVAAHLAQVLAVVAPGSRVLGSGSTAFGKTPRPCPSDRCGGTPRPACCRRPNNWDHPPGPS